MNLFFCVFFREQTRNLSAKSSCFMDFELVRGLKGSFLREVVMALTLLGIDLFEWE